MSSPRANEDARRFQAWQLDALAARPAGTELLEIGPFRAVMPAAADSSGWVTIVDAAPTERETLAGVAELSSIFRTRTSPLEIEYNETLYPGVGRWLEAAGLTVSERNPLMACRPSGFAPFAAPGVTLDRLTPSSTAADLQAFQKTRWTNGGDNNEVPPPVDQLRKDLQARSSVYLLARLDGRIAGTGVSHSLRGAVEIVGVVTQADLRRRRVAATVTSDLVDLHFASGGDFAFLDAANEEAARVYERIGFVRFGANLVYRRRSS